MKLEQEICNLGKFNREKEVKLDNLKNYKKLNKKVKKLLLLKKSSRNKNGGGY